MFITTATRVTSLVMLVTSVAACSVRTAPDSTPAPLAGISRVAAPPEWRPGDRWVYDWTAGTDRAVKTVELLEVREVNGVSFYVVKVGEIEQYYTRALEWAATVKNGTVEARMVPPQSWFTWPLEAGAQWTFQGLFQDRGVERQHNDRFTVVTTERLLVPAGQFQALKIVRETGTGDSDEYWYAPDVRWYARWHGRRGSVEFDEQLREYRPAPRTMSEPPPTR